MATQTGVKERTRIVLVAVVNIHVQLLYEVLDSQNVSCFR